MLSCADSERLIISRADGAPLDASSAAALDSHLEGCASCREALAAQDAVAAILRNRPADEVSPGFSARLARRLDERTDFFDSIDWRAWTFRLTPIAAALALAAYLTTAETDPAAIDEWAAPAGGTVSSMLQDSGVTSESLLEQMLTGEAAVGGGSSVR